MTDKPTGAPGSGEDRALLRELLATQMFAVLSTQSEGQPYASLVAFAVDEAMEYVIFATLRKTRKYANMAAHPRISVLIDDRTNTPADLMGGTAVTITGEAEELGFHEWDLHAPIFLAKFPGLKEFLARDCALLRLRIQTFDLSRRFIPEETPEG